jgi:UDP-GlcNAc:undecaprenyl-phosphate GlcNAc-1-phosphate transferase
LNLKNKLFLGDSGIYLLGAVLSFSLIYEYNVNKNFLKADDIFVLLMLPGFDLLRLSLTRILSGRNAFVGDRNHIHHLLNKKFSLLKTNLILIIMFSVPILFKNLIMLNNLNTIFLFLLIYCILINLIQRK